MMIFRKPLSNFVSISRHQPPEAAARSKLLTALAGKKVFPWPSMSSKVIGFP